MKLKAFKSKATVWLTLQSDSKAKKQKARQVFSEQTQRPLETSDAYQTLCKALTLQEL